MKKLVFLALLTTLSTNVFAEESKKFLSFGIGTAGFKTTLDYNNGIIEEGGLNGSSFSFEIGNYNLYSLNPNLNLVFGIDFSRAAATKTSDKSSNQSIVKENYIRIPTLGYNIYLSSNSDNSTYYLGLGLIESFSESIKLKITYQNDESIIFTKLSPSFGNQIKLGFNYKLRENMIIGLEYKYVTLNTKLDELKYYDETLKNYIGEKVNVDSNNKIKQLH